MDQVTLSKLGMTIWTWEVNHGAKKNLCTKINGKTGRWENEVCTTKLSYACKQESHVPDAAIDANNWDISAKGSGSISNANVWSCPAGFIPGHPTTPLEAKALTAALSNTADAWINVFASSDWTDTYHAPTGMHN
jgi:hypothetical protein